MSETDVPRRSRSGSETRQRRVILTTRLSPEEHAQLQADASAAGMAVGSFARLKLFDGAAPRSVRRPPVELEELSRLLGQLGKMGSNLNQIAHKLNAELPLTPGYLQEALRDIRVMRDGVLAALGYEVER